MSATTTEAGRNGATWWMRPLRRAKLIRPTHRSTIRIGVHLPTTWREGRVAPLHGACVSPRGMCPGQAGRGHVSSPKGKLGTKGLGEGFTREDLSSLQSPCKGQSAPVASKGVSTGRSVALFERSPAILIERESSFFREQAQSCPLEPASPEQNSKVHLRHSTF